MLATFHFELDYRGLQCPIPVIRTKTYMSSLDRGKIIKVISTDPASPKNFKALCDHNGYALFEIARQNDEYVFYIKK